MTRRSTARWSGGNRYIARCSSKAIAEQIVAEHNAAVGAGPVTDTKDNLDS